MATCSRTRTWSNSYFELLPILSYEIYQGSELATTVTRSSVWWHSPLPHTHTHTQPSPQLVSGMCHTLLNFQLPSAIPPGCLCCQSEDALCHILALSPTSMKARATARTFLLFGAHFPNPSIGYYYALYIYGLYMLILCVCVCVCALYVVYIWWNY